MILFVVALGGALGALARYAVAGWVQTGLGVAFPAGTFAVNAAGSLLLGLFARLAEGWALAPETRALVAIGFLGAFTTFSTFSVEGLALLQAGDWGRAALYLGGGVAVGLAAAAAGLALGGVMLRGG